MRGAFGSPQGFLHVFEGLFSFWFLGGLMDTSNLVNLAKKSGYKPVVKEN